MHLPAPMDPLESVQTVVNVGNQLFVSGLGPFKDGKLVVSFVGTEVSLADAEEAARFTMLMILSCLQQAYGLDNIERYVRITVYVC